MTASITSRRLLAPEVVQTSAMDCGPAALKCALDGHGIPVSYARLRDACQTDVDGTSIDTIETLANQLGLTAEQIMLPADHLLVPQAAALPAIVVVTLAGGVTHFVVLWRRYGPLVQVMDPGSGRRWMSHRRLLEELYLHRTTIPAADWRVWASTPEFRETAIARLTQIGITSPAAGSMLDRAASDPSWHGLAALDAIVRLVHALIESGGVRKGAEAQRMVEGLAGRLHADAAADRLIPERYWSVRPVEADADGHEQLTMTGAVLVRFPGTRATASPEAGALTAEVLASLRQPPPRPLREIGRMLREDRAFLPGVLLAAALLAAGGVIGEALLFRGLLDLGHALDLREQRLVAMGALLLFTLLVTAIEFPMSSWLVALGRRLEGALRLRVFEKIPRLDDRYFRSRLASDLAERVHSLHVLRQVPPLAGRFTRLCCEIVATTAGIVWIDPDSAAWAVSLAAATLAIPVASQIPLTELELRLRTHAGALSRYYLDALIGLVPVRAHSAERALRREYTRVVEEWLKTGVQFLRVAVTTEAIQTTLGYGLAAALLWSHLGRGGEAASLLLMYWALQIPMLGDELALIVRQYPATRNVMLRLLEPLETPVPDRPSDAATIERGPRRAPASPGVAVSIRGVDVHVAGRPVLSGVTLDIAPGSHVAVVGASGAGKSTLAGLLLGWHTPTAGHVVIDGQVLDAAGVHALRQMTAWVDPGVQLWNRSLLHNLQYGNATHAHHTAAFHVVAADLRELIQKLPQGLQTSIGESGGLVSGGEGQRVRLGRALLRQDVRLVILDEPFRGLDRETRRRLLALVCDHYRGATLLCITHDVAETRTFDRVIVMHESTVDEDNHPVELARVDSRYRRLLDAEREVHERLWSDEVWRHVEIDDGRAVERSLEARA